MPRYTEQNMSQQRLQELSDIKYQIENNINNEKKLMTIMKKKMVMI